MSSSTSSSHQDGAASIPMAINTQTAGASHNDGRSAPPTPPLSLTLPFGAQPDIIRANQKDVYYQSILHEQISSVCQRFLGSRRQHQWQREINTLSDFCYYGLTTLLGTQTLGEEYCDLVQIDQYAEVYPGFIRRTALVFVQTLLPYIYTRTIAEFKKQNQRRLRGVQHHHHEDVDINVTTTVKKRIQQFVQNTLPTLQDFALNNIRPAHLAIFYFFGAYYSFSKRLTGIRYMFTRQLGPHEQRAGYEVLGVLIVLQLMIQAGLELRKRWVSYQETIAPPSPHLTLAAASSETLDNEITEKDSNELAGNAKEQAIQEEQDNDDFDFMNAFDQSKEEDTHIDPEQLSLEALQMLKCALCLEPRKVTTTTPCGHLFCWSCIVEWCQNKPECPLCRSHVNVSHLIPLNNF